MKNFFLKDNPYLLASIIVSVIFGFIAGFVGGLYTNTYIFQNTLSDAINGTKNGGVAELVKLRQFLGLKEDLQANQILKRLDPSIIGIYQNTETTPRPFDESNFLGNALILTNDGWIITHEKVVENIALEQLFAVAGGKSYSLEKILTDSATEIVFIKVNSLSAIPVEFVDFEDVNVGETVLVLNAVGDLTILHIKNVFMPAEQTTNLLERYFVLDNTLPKEYQGAAILNLNGEIVGLVDLTTEKQLVTPSGNFISIIKNILNSENARRPHLGVGYIDLSWASGVVEGLELGSNLGQGAYVTQNPQFNTPAAIGDIKIGDIIISVDGQRIDKQNTLNVIIQEYQVGDRVELEILRNDQTIKTEVFLGIIENENPS